MDYTNWTPSELADLIGLTNILDETRNNLNLADKLKYTKVRANILNHQGSEVTLETVAWLYRCLAYTASK